MDNWLAPAAALFVAVLGGPPLLLRLSRKHRLRTRIAADLNLIEKMPTGLAKDRLIAQIEHDTLQLIASEEPFTEHERRRQDQGFRLSMVVAPLSVLGCCL